MKRAGNTFDVRYRYGMSAGNAYVFEALDDCWRLVADPEPHAP